MAKRPALFEFKMSGTTKSIFIVPDNILTIFYDTTQPGITTLDVHTTQYAVAADAATVVSKIGADSMVQVSQFGQPSNILFWISLKRISAVYVASDEPNFTPGPVGATRIITERIIDVSDPVATITAALGTATVITYP